jgi:hypothetical protein
MTNRRIAARCLSGAVAAVLLAGPVLGQSESPSQAYLGFVAAAPKARSLEELLPRLSAEYQAMLTAQPKEQQPVWLERLKDSVDMVDVKITKETIVGGKCTLEGTAKSRKGLPLHGKVQLVKENGGWKLDEQMWST